MNAQHGCLSGPDGYININISIDFFAMEDKREKRLPPEEGKSDSSKLNIRSSSAGPAADALISTADADGGSGSKDVFSNPEAVPYEEGAFSEAAADHEENEGDPGSKPSSRSKDPSAEDPALKEHSFKDPSAEDPALKGRTLKDQASEGSSRGEEGRFGKTHFPEEGGDSAEPAAFEEQPPEQTPSGDQQSDKGDSAQNEGKELENTLDSVRKAPAKRKWKTRKEKETEYREKILRHRRKVYRRTLASVVCCMVVIVAAVLFWMSRGYSRAELSRVCSISTSETDSYENLGGNLVRYGASGAVCVDHMGNTLWNVSYEMQQPVTSVGKNVIAIANRGGNNVYIMNSRGLMGSIRTMLPIHSIAVAENGNVAVIMNDTKTTWVRLYNKKGTEIAYIVRSMEENGYPIAAAVSPNGKILCLSCVQMSNSVVKSNVSFFDFGKKEDEVQGFKVDSFDYIDEVIPHIFYMDNYVCYGVSDKRLISFQRGFIKIPGSGDHFYKERLPVQGVFHSESFIGFLFHNPSHSTEYCLKIFNRRCKETSSINFSMRYSNITISGDKVYINNERQCQIYSLDGRRLYDGEFGKTILALIPGARLTDLLAVTEGEVDAVRLY